MFDQACQSYESPDSPPGSPYHNSGTPPDDPTGRPGTPHGTPLDAPPLESDLRAELTRVQELADYRKQLLEDSEWRYHELLQQVDRLTETNLGLVKALPLALADSTAETNAAPEPAPRRRRRWWPFGSKIDRIWQPHKKPMTVLRENINTRNGSSGVKFFRRIMLAQGAYQADSSSQRIRAGPTGLGQRARSWSARRP